jgi:hypothetical protein
MYYWIYLMCISIFKPDWIYIQYYYIHEQYEKIDQSIRFVGLGDHTHSEALFEKCFILSMIPPTLQVIWIDYFFNILNFTIYVNYVIYYINHNICYFIVENDVMCQFLIMLMVPIMLHNTLLTVASILILKRTLCSYENVLSYKC